jgi:Holliday junction resolvase RusA-like endonuclease
MKVLLNVSIPGEPQAQQRHRWGKGRVYDPSAADKDNFRWQLRAAVPALRPNLTARIGVRITVYTDSWQHDADNFLKFYMDALSPSRGKKLPKKLRAQLMAQAFAIWGNDNQVDQVEITVHRNTAPGMGSVHIFVYENPKEELWKAGNQQLVGSSTS